MAHKPVLLKEVIEFIQPESGDKFIDGTAGDGGYILAIANENEYAKILGIDLDQISLDKLGNKLALRNLSQRVTLVHGNFKNIKHIAKSSNFDSVSGVILDLGFSSSQLDDASRGLSFQTNGPLDMRLDPSSDITAKDVVNSYEQNKLARIFQEFGEEKFAAKIAANIVRERKSNPINTTGELFGIINGSLPKPILHKASDYARRIFQAIRIEVNQELDNLKSALPEILDLLEPGGKMLITSFHSLEDRIVKKFMVDAAKGCICPPDFPQCVCGKNPLLKILNKKPITASDEEIKNNPRSKPAKLRVAQKIKN